MVNKDGTNKFVKRSEKMRKIKFRVWDKDTKRMLYQTDIEYYDDMIGIRFDSDIMGKQKDIISMQYTGIKDKNGKEIYESDIVKSPCGIHKVIFVGGGFCLDTGGIATDLYRMIDSKGNHLEVIGNIYENPKIWRWGK